MDPITQAIVIFLRTNGLGLNDALGPLFGLIGTTPLEFTTANPMVDTAWHVMTGVADSFLVLFAVMGIIQMLHGQHTGTPYLPAGQFLARMLLVVVMVHLSFMLGQDLLIINNFLCGIVNVDLQGFIRQLNGGLAFTNGQNALLSAFVGIVAGISLIRLLFQAVKRIVFFNVLFVLSGPAFLASFLPQTSAWFAYWARTYVVTIFTQFFQFLTLGLGLQFLLATKQTGLVGFILAIAMLNMVAEIPTLLARFAASSGASVAGVGGLVRTGLVAAQLFM
jgi:hypothetical protein